MKPALSPVERAIVSAITAAIVRELQVGTSAELESSPVQKGGRRGGHRVRPWPTSTSREPHQSYRNP
jgi:hypothetical protein